MSLFRRYLNEATDVARLISSGKEFQARIEERKKELLNKLVLAWRDWIYIRSRAVRLTLNWRLLMRFNLVITFLVILSIRLNQVHEFEKVIPRCLWVSVSVRITSFMKRGGCWSGFWKSWRDGSWWAVSTGCSQFAMVCPNLPPCPKLPDSTLN